MIRALRLLVLTFIAIAAASSWLLAQNAPPPKQAEELPAEAKAFNAAAGEKDPLKRVAALEKFIADNPKAASILVSQAKALISSSALAAYKESRAKYLAGAEAEIAEATKRTDG